MLGLTGLDEEVDDCSDDAERYEATPLFSILALGYPLLCVRIRGYACSGAVAPRVLSS